VLTKVQAKASIADSAFKGLRHRQNIEGKKFCPASCCSPGASWCRFARSCGQYS
jgi:hypothetical protein